MNRLRTATPALALAFVLAGCGSGDGSAAGETQVPTAASPASSGGEVAVGTQTAITLTAGDTVITAMLNDSQASRDFLATLPATLSWERAYGIEYGTELAAPLNEDGPFYEAVKPGDIVYYNPEDSITILFGETTSIPTLTLLGEITSDLGAFEALPEHVEFRIIAGE